MRRPTRSCRGSARSWTTTSRRCSPAVAWTRGRRGRRRPHHAPPFRRGPPLPRPGRGPSSPAPGDPVRVLRVSPPPDRPPLAWNVLEQCRLDPDRPASGSYDRLAAARVSRTDPDAALMNSRTRGHASLGYHDHYVVDGGKARVILQALVTPADVMENQPMLDLLWRGRFRWHLHPKRAVAATKYATIDTIRVLEEAGIRAYMPLATWDRTPLYGPSRFSYDPEHDEYRCPQGQPLRRQRAYHDREVWLYRAEPATCNGCPVKPQCT